MLLETYFQTIHNQFMQFIKSSPTPAYKKNNRKNLTGAKKWPEASLVSPINFYWSIF